MGRNSEEKDVEEGQARAWTLRSRDSAASVFTNVYVNVS